MTQEFQTGLVMPGLASEPLGQTEPAKSTNGPPSGLGNMSFPLTMLVESTIHKAYGELSNLAELLQGKEDMHRFVFASIYYPSIFFTIFN